MIKVGSIVNATVYREEPYGVFLRGQDDNARNFDIFVHLPEVSWTEYVPANQLGLLNKSISVKVIKYDEKKDQWVASIKEAHPEMNPYIPLKSYEWGTVFDGVVYRKTVDHTYVKLLGGAVGRVIENPNNQSTTMGNKVSVSIVNLDAEGGKLELKVI